MNVSLFSNKGLSEAEIAHKRYKLKHRVTSIAGPIARFFVLFGMCFVIMYPLMYMLSTAFSPQAEMSDPSRIWIPKKIIFSNLVDAWHAMSYPKTFWTTLYLNLGSSLIQVLACALTGYGFARFKFKGQGFLFGIVIMMIIVPPQILSIPVFMQFFNFPLGSLINTPLAMYLPALFANGLRAGLFILIFRQFFKGLPKELEDAAYLDGCGPFKTFVRVMAPNAGSSFLTVFLFSIVWYWNDSYVSVIFVNNLAPMSVMVQNLTMHMAQQIYGKTDIPGTELIVWMEAGALLSILPILVMYVFLQKYFTEGIERSGIVG